MKKKVTLLIILSALFIGGCGNSDNSVLLPSESKLIVDDESEEIKSEEIVNETESESEELSNIIIPPNVCGLEEEICDDKSVSDNDIEESTEVEIDHRFDGLAVANWHNVKVKAGTSYNDVIKAVTKGTRAYKDTYPYIYDADLNTPGVYTCYWGTKVITEVINEETGEITEVEDILLLDYTAFTITVTE